METRRIELLTSTLPGLRSPSSEVFRQEYDEVRIPT